MTARQPVTHPVEGRLRLTTLGVAALAHISPDTQATELLTMGKPLGLLVYLACCPGRTATREHLIDLLWADSEPDGARHALRQAIWFLHQRIGADAILAGNHELTLAAPLESDRDAFVTAVEQRDLERAIELYRGDFLPGFAAPGGAEFEHWADLERDRLRLMFRRSAEAVVRDWLSRGRLRKARQLATRIRDQNPRDESGWRLLLEALVAANDTVQAELEAAALERLLAEEQRAPERSTNAALLAARQRPITDGEAVRVGLHSELIARETDFATILGAWQAAEQSAGQHIHVVAAPGIGKTRLLADVHSRLRATGAQVALVRASPGNRPIAYALASDIAQALAAFPGAAAISSGAASALVALNPTLSARYAAQPDRSTDAEGLRRRAIALHELLACVSDERPVALLIDDLHWADFASRQLLEDLMSRIGSHHVLAVTSARSQTEGATAPTAAKVIALAPLSAEDTLELLASLGRLPGDSWAQQFPHDLHAATRGSPLLVLQSLQLALERGWLELEENEWQCSDWEALRAELARGGPMRQRIRELPASERALLLLLALAGTQLESPVLAAATAREEEAVQRDLHALEVRGLVLREAHAWIPAHDEIAARVVELSSETLELAHAQLGLSLGSRAGMDQVLLRRAARHLLNGEQRAELAAVFERWMISARRQHDDRGVAALARDFLPDSAGVEIHDWLIRSLPVRLRWPPKAVRRAAGVGAAVLLLAGIGAGAMLRREAGPDAVLVVIPQDIAARVTAVPLRSEHWASLDRIEPSAMGRPVPALAKVPRDRSDWVASPVDGAWAFSHLTPDSGGINLYIVSREGNTRRLTTGPAEDDTPTWSPDGHLIAFSTDRWDRINHRQHLAAVDVRTGAIRHLTSGTGGDLTPYWSPDGTRIAYRSQTGEGDRLCWVTVDGTRTECLPTKPLRADRLLGWYDARRMPVMLDTGEGMGLATVDGNSWEITKLGGAADVASPDGRWGARSFSPGSGERRTWQVFPTDRPADMRDVVTDEGSLLRWASIGAGHYLDSLRIDTPDTIVLGVSHRLWLAGRDRGGHPVDVSVVSWRSNAPSVATVDDSGIVTPRQVGDVVIRASAGGWREAAVRLVIRSGGSHVVMREDWSSAFGERWRLFGDPLPAIVQDPLGKQAFWNNGDGWFHSGAYTQSRFDASHGLGMEAQLSTPITGPRAEELLVSLVSWLDTTLLARWDHRIGAIPQGRGESCGALVPGGEQRPAHGQLFWSLPQSPVTLTRSQLGGMWWSLRLQILPDGRCIGSIDGRVVSVSASPLRLDRPFGVLLQGSSLGTKMLVGTVEVWEGVKYR